MNDVRMRVGGCNYLCESGALHGVVNAAIEVDFDGMGESRICDRHGFGILNICQVASRKSCYSIALAGGLCSGIFVRGILEKCPTAVGRDRSNEQSQSKLIQHSDSD